MAKYKVEFKKEVVKYYKEHGVSATKTKYKISDCSIYNWVHQSDNIGSEAFKRKKSHKYSFEDKLKIIEFMKLNGPTAAYNKYMIRHSVVQKWERILLEQGESALSQDHRGRPKKDIVKMDVDENEDLLAEVQRLRMENAYLKKLKALVQQREEKQRKK